MQLGEREGVSTCVMTRYKVLLKWSFRHKRGEGWGKFWIIFALHKLL